ncbi:hypothetical protein QCM8_209 [Bacillus phage QCM8]|nr:hypothetical protein QCM8_209 [Bacillus phage QCM8]UGO47768.1 hypothetical protein MCCARTNEY_194 [Bacillus phage vB_BanH_McCartney]UGO49278.1 hypothetical protein EMILIAHAH_192 [Bacillus phage vB_BanH_Emiliahah]
MTMATMIMVLNFTMLLTSATVTTVQSCMIMKEMKRRVD